MIQSRNPFPLAKPGDDAAEVRMATENVLRLLARMVAKACIKELASDPQRRGQIPAGSGLIPVAGSSPAPEPQAKLLLSIMETGRLLGVSRSTAYQLAQTRRIPTIRLGGRVLVPRAALLEMIRNASA